MQQSEFQYNLTGARTLAEHSSPPESDFWQGYQRGLRQHFHGAAFGTDDEHTLWMALADEERDDSRRHRGLGYRTGFSGASVADAIKAISESVQKPTRSTIIIRKRGEGYISDVSGKFGGGHSGCRCGLTAYEAAAHAAQMMIRYGQSNPEGADLMAPPEVLELVPGHLKSIAAQE